MFSKILFPTDFSRASEKVKNEIIKIAKCNIKEVVLLNVVDVRIFSYNTYMDTIEIENFQFQGEIVKITEKKLQLWKKELEDAGLKVTAVIKEGIPFDEILNYAETEDTTCIFMGHVGRTAVERMLLGSTAEKVSRKAKIPVLLVRWIFEFSIALTTLLYISFMEEAWWIFQIKNWFI